MPIGKLKAHFILCRVLVLSLVFSLQPSLGGIEPGDAAGSKAEATQRAEDAFRAGRYADALRELRGVLERYPDDGLTLRRAGVASLAMGDVLEAVRFLERATVVLPSDPLCWGYLGVAAGQAGDLVIAHEYLARACGMAPDNLELRGKLVETLCALKEWELALTQIEMALRVEGSGVEWERIRAGCAMEAGKWELASERLARLWTLPGSREDRAAVGRSYGKVLLWSGRYQEAADVLGRSFETTGVKEPDSLLNLVRALVLSGELAEGKRFVQEHVEEIGFPWAELWTAGLASEGEPPAWLFDPAAFCPQQEIGSSWLFPEMLGAGDLQELVIEVDRQQAFPPIPGLLEEAEAFLVDALGLSVRWLTGDILPFQVLPEDPAVVFASNLDGLTTMGPGRAYLRIVLFDAGVPGPSFVDTPFPAMYVNASEWAGQVAWARTENLLPVRFKHLLGHAIGLSECVGENPDEPCVMKPSAWVRFEGEGLGLCAACRGALRARRSGERTGGAQVWRPRFSATANGLVRHGTDYSAEFSPHRVLLRAAAGAELAPLKDPEPQMRLIAIEILTDLAKAGEGISSGRRVDRAALSAGLQELAQSDPDPRVRLLAETARGEVDGVVLEGVSP